MKYPIPTWEGALRFKFAYVIAAAISFGAAQAATAADLPVKAPVYKAAAPYNWTGLYIGGTVGYVWGRSQHCDTSAFCTDTFDVNGFAGGVTLGYNWQVNNWVLGIETDFSGARAKGDTPTIPGVYGCGAECHTKLDWFGTVRGRVGPTFDNFFPYLTGGFAYGRLYADLGIPAVSSASGTKSGWTAGGGIEYALAAQHWSVKLEYLYFELGDLFYDTAQVCGSLSCTAVDNRFSVLRAGLNYRF